MTTKKSGVRLATRRTRQPRTVQKAVYVIVNTSEAGSLEAVDWSLTGEQMLYLMQHNNLIVSAFTADDYETLRAFADSKEFRYHFGTMGFDEAYDRYLTAIEEGRA